MREPLFNEEERKAMMLAEHRRREEVSPIFFSPKGQFRSQHFSQSSVLQIKKLLEDEDEEHLNSAWSNPKQLATGLQGLSSVSWKPK